MIVALAGLIVAASGDAAADGARLVASVIGKDQVISRSVKDQSLLVHDFSRSERERLRGEPGPKGEQGPSAQGRVRRLSQAFTIPTARLEQCPGTSGPIDCWIPVTEHTTGTVNCTLGEVVVGGGAEPDDPKLTDLNESYPTADGKGWAATVGNDDITRPHRFTLYVLCGSASNP